MKQNIINKLKDWGILFFWISCIVAFLYLIITVKEFELIH